MATNAELVSIPEDDPLSRKIRTLLHQLKQREIEALRNRLQCIWADIEEELAEWEWVKLNRRRLRLEYGEDGLKLISKAVDESYYIDDMTDAQRWVWAEDQYARGEILC